MSHRVRRPSVAAVAEAIARLYDQVHRPAIAFARRRLRDRQAAEDAVQEAYVRVTRVLRAGKFRHEAALATFFVAVLARHVVDLNRAAVRRARPEGDGIARAPSGPGEDPARRAEEAELLELVEGRIAQLPSRARRALRLRLRGRSLARIASALGVEPATAGVILFRSRQELPDVL